MDWQQVLASLHHQLTARKGTYALALWLKHPQRITIGALGIQTFPGAHYLYIGSAWGSGGIRARLARHIRGSPKQHWHIDYLRAYAQPVGYWSAPGAHVECAWSSYVASLPQAHEVIAGFGASDCDCVTHLYHWDSPSFNTLILPVEYHFMALSQEGL